ncbi:hypothetical protein BU24DRAFT_425610 [Aaosphaeria arxii CBS 175.79]|uniref:RlpA-like protein double-psi beta-barrel domain-containing protein n=1 Tax=Aaosphaeria arxii CBS 175.79 TaxID=1450172 RepID=A0A6A5XJQ7_9PLEO|nr:uncharacterized protein BU24DRAFT_425610 [Aaosphaeria arxii CBS 175.79]KAF2013047.1 hypothetical protein BU24DRAFT_425610 [Aaosphaeria arxii CBS 175.79]
MATYEEPQKPLPAFKKETDVDDAPNWDIPEEGAVRQRRFRIGGAATGWAISDRFDRILPPHKRYLGRSRRTLLIGIGVVFLLLLGLIIGLAVGLSKKSSGPKNIPLPNGAETYTGDLTFYDPGLGACGIDSTSSDHIVAISHFTFDAAQKGSDPNQNPLCRRKIRARRVNEDTGKTVSIDLTVVDRCTGCQPTDIDVSPAVFNQLSNPDLGRVPVTWAWL